MMMDSGRQGPDDDVVRLLGKLRDTGPAYPPRMYTARRAAVLAGLAALQIGGMAASASLFAKIAKLVKGMSVVEKIVLGVEVAAVTGMTAYGATAAYIYRDQLRQLLLPGPSITTAFPSLSVPSTLPPGNAFGLTGTPTPSPTGSLTVTPFFYTSPPGGDSTPPPLIQPTQEPPTEAPPATKPGNSFGLTKNAPTETPAEP